eukprot:TRINITY_DN21636_c1_g4_i4.p1 TRINITY_DN21636_c1_g4~~TRINITY_DN21636_c1_g4_i4.p1  ORF type:complete len:118 (-),score=52.17 TRINITY_DN21636_c1_g4_i4:176-529(-)
MTEYCNRDNDINSTTATTATTAAATTTTTAATTATTTMAATATTATTAEDIFEDVANVCARLDLPTLKEACVIFARSSKAIQQKLKSKGLSSEVMKVLSADADQDESCEPKKKRRML